MKEIKIDELEKVNGGSAIGGKQSVSLLEAVVAAINRTSFIHPGLVDKADDLKF